MGFQEVTGHPLPACCSMLQCVAACCSVIQCDYLSLFAKETIKRGIFFQKRPDKITTAGISFNSPYISNTFSRESRNFHSNFHACKRSPRHSKNRARGKRRGPGAAARHSQSARAHTDSFITIIFSQQTHFHPKNQVEPETQPGLVGIKRVCGVFRQCQWGP